MKLYLAAPYAARDLIREHMAPQFVAAGHTITSGWLQASREINPGHLGTSPASPLEDVMYHAGKDLEEVAAAQVLVHFTAGFLTARWPHLDSPRFQLHSGGRHTETGYALALHRSVLIMGEPENIFQRGLCHHCPTPLHALQILEEMDELAEDNSFGELPH